MNLAELTEQLHRIHAAGRKFFFVEQAHRVLRQVPRAPKLASLTLETLVELGLGGPARELVQIRRDLSGATPDLAGLESTIGSLPNGRVPWSERREVYECNLAALLGRRPHLRPLVDSLQESLAELNLYRTTQGDFQLSRRRRAGQLREWLLSLTDEGEGAATQLPPKEKLGPPVIVGVRVGALISRLHKDTHHWFLNYSHPLYIVEADFGRFAAWLHAADLSELLSEERVYVLIGPACAGDLRRLLTEEPDLPVPTTVVSQQTDRSLVEQITQTAESVLAERNKELADLLKEIETRYRDRDLAYWAKRVQRPGRVLGVTSRFTTMLQYSMRDSLEALEDCGYESHLIIEKKDHHQSSCAKTCREILEFDPDLLIFIDHLRYEYPYLPKNIPMLTWIQDPMDNLLCRRAGESIGPLDFVCGYYLDRCTKQFGYPADRFLPTHIPVSTRLFHDRELRAETMAEYGCDISFVSHASIPIERFYASALPTYAGSYRPMLERLYERAATLDESSEHGQPVAAAFDLVRSVAAEVGLALEESQVQFVAINFVYRLFDWGRRQETLEWVGDWAKRTGRVFKIYGRGWENHPTLSQFACGVIEHGEPLRRAYRASRLALQLIASGFRHQRSYELLAAGTLPLSRYCRADFASPRAVALYPRLERIVFRSREEFETLAEQFLANEPYRQEVLSELREVILRNYTYTAVIGEILNKWRNYFSSRLAGSEPDAAAAAPVGAGYASSPTPR